MRIFLMKFLEGAARARGTAVVIDVFRAASLASYALAKGATRIVPVATLEEAFALRREHPDWILAGERDCLRPEGFDYGNSPFEIANADLAGKTVVHSTSAGTKGLAAAMAAGADEVYFLSFPNMGATARRILADNPAEVSIVAMGKAAAAPAPEDDLCAMYLKNELENVPNVFSAIAGFLRHTDSASIFFGETAIVPEEDFAMCLDLDAVDFALLAAPDPEDGLMSLRKIEAPAPAGPSAPGMPGLPGGKGEDA